LTVTITEVAGHSKTSVADTVDPLAGAVIDTDGH
jgi:hypothetical protein